MVLSEDRKQVDYMAISCRVIGLGFDEAKLFAASNDRESYPFWGVFIEQYYQLLSVMGREGTRL